MHTSPAGDLLVIDGHHYFCLPSGYFQLRPGPPPHAHLLFAQSPGLAMDIAVAIRRRLRTGTQFIAL